MDDIGFGDRERLSVTMLRPEQPAESVGRSSSQTSPAVDAAQSAATPAGARRRRAKRLILLIGALALVVTGGGSYWALTRDRVSTDDAFIDGNLVPISPRIAGTVERVFITDNQRVGAGDILVELDARDQQAAFDNAAAALASAEAQHAEADASLQLLERSTDATLHETASGLAAMRSTLAQAKAQVTVTEAEMQRAKGDADRYQTLAAEGYASRQRLEQAVAAARASAASWLAAQQAVHVAEARIAEAEGRHAQAATAPQQIAVRKAMVAAAAAEVEKARAAVDQAKLDLEYTRVPAPHAGFITRKAVQPGDVVQRNQTLAWIVFGDPWVTANFKETQLTDMQPGQPVQIAVDAYPGVDFTGRVDSIQRGTGARFSLLPPENATGNFVKVVQRVPVKIVFDPVPEPSFVLGLGMSVVPTVRLGDVPGEMHGEIHGEATTSPAAAKP